MVELLFSSSFTYYSVFHLFRQAKFDNGGSILSSSQFFATAQAASKNEARFKSGQKWFQNNQLANNDLKSLHRSKFPSKLLNTKCVWNLIEVTTFMFTLQALWEIWFYKNDLQGQESKKIHFQFQ
jgi:hypothetical protein